MTRDEQWAALWKKEKTTCQEYTGHRNIVDWQAYDGKMEARRKAAWHWISDQIERLKDGKDQSDTEEKTKGRIEYMQAVLDGYSNFHWQPLPNYPRADASNRESVYIRERDFYCSFFGDQENRPPYQEQQARKKQNYDSLVDRRKWLLDCVHGDVDGEPPGWDARNRRQRYDNLQIATHHGPQWEQWRKGTYVPLAQRKSWRDKVADWHNDHLGITEDPAGSNCDNRSDGIRHAQDTCANGTWLRNQPWCGVWAFMGLKAAGLVKSGDDSWMASVSSIEDYARQGKGPFRGWTTDGSKAKKGDLVVLFGRGVHVGTVRDIDSSSAYTWEGNTSSGSVGSQSNGGGSYKRQRSRSSETYGYALVRDP